MKSVETLIDQINSYNPSTDQQLVRYSYALAQQMHEGKLRHSGEPNFSHPIPVGLFLSQ